MITSLWRRNDVTTSFRRHNDVIFASLTYWECFESDDNDNDDDDYDDDEDDGGGGDDNDRRTTTTT